MDKNIFNEKDLKDIRERGIAPEEILKQIEIFKRGSSFADIIRPCTIGDGIKKLEGKDISGLTAVYSKAQAAGRAMKFVPASGAATRMFKELMAANIQSESFDPPSILEQADTNGDYRLLLNFIENIKRFPFYDDLRSIMSRDGIEIESTVARGNYNTVLEYALYKRGLNLAGLPKALISFHRYKDCSRTPVEEHLAEVADYTLDAYGKGRVHFTVSIEHEDAIEAHVKGVKGRYEKSGSDLEINFSSQKPSTDTIAVNADNSIFRETNGRLVFRPGGHGALLENLSDLKGDIIFIKNIDNVAPDRLRAASTIYKKALAGYLVELQERIFSYLKILEKGGADDVITDEIFSFIGNDLSIDPTDGIQDLSLNKKTEYLYSVLNRPVRVCGMVRNQAEPGGGPFWVQHTDGGVSLQIVEKSQINTEDGTQRGIMEASTHFNPVDLICGVRDFNGRPFELKKYVDPDTYFISIKSKDGRDLKALELPGLWNGAMAFWNTVFIEVPIITFNPVKTVFDLLRDEHQTE